MTASRRLLPLVVPILLLPLPLALRPTRASQDAAPEIPTLPQSGRIASEPVARNAPFFVARPDGSVTLGCVAWTAGEGDRIELRDALRAAGSSDPPRVVSATPDEIVRPVGVVDAKGRLLVVWTQRDGDRAQLACARETVPGGAFAPPSRLTHGPRPNLNAEVVAHEDGRIFVAWEGDVAAAEGASDPRSNRDVLLAPITDDGA